MFKKITLLSLACVCSMSYAAKVRMVALNNTRVATIKHAHALALKHGTNAPLVAKYAKLVAQGLLEIERGEYQLLFDEMCDQFQCESEHLI